MPDGMEAFMADLDRGVATALVPGLIWVEAASVLLKKINRGEIKDSEAIELLRLWRTLPFKEIETSASILEILKLARNESLSSYDATYLYLAIQHHAVLFTADDLLTKAAQRYRT